MITVLSDGFDRIRDTVHHAADGLTVEELAFRIDGRANSIGWLVWHLTRIQDDHVTAVAGTAGTTGAPQVWTSRGWHDRFGLPFDAADTGYGHGGADVAAVRVGAQLLTGYHDDVYARTVEYVASLTDDDLARVVDRSWDPPVTLAVRLVSVLSDDLQHAGQAAFVRGLLP